MLLSNQGSVSAKFCVNKAHINLILHLLQLLIRTFLFMLEETER